MIGYFWLIFIEIKPPSLFPSHGKKFKKKFQKTFFTIFRLKYLSLQKNQLFYEKKSNFLRAPSQDGIIKCTCFFVD